jgi:hypothetical protein
MRTMEHGNLGIRVFLEGNKRVEQGAGGVGVNCVTHIRARECDNGDGAVATAAYR